MINMSWEEESWEETAERIFGKPPYKLQELLSKIKKEIPVKNDNLYTLYTKTEEFIGVFDEKGFCLTCGKKYNEKTMNEHKGHFVLTAVDDEWYPAHPLMVFMEALITISKLIDEGIIEF